MDFLVLLTLPVLALSPFAVLLAKPLRRHPNRRARVLGGAMAMVSLWFTFNLSLAVFCGGTVMPLVLEEPRCATVALLIAQVPALWAAQRVAFTEIAPRVPPA